MAEDENRPQQEDPLVKVQQEEALREQLSQNFRLSELDEFKNSLNTLQTLEGPKVEDEREAIREIVYEHFSEIVDQGLGYQEFVAEKLLRNEFPYPYDSRQGATWFTAMVDEVGASLSKAPEDGGLKGESRQWMETLYDALKWGHGQHSIGEGLNMVQWYYGALDGMASGLPNMKHKIGSEDFVDGFTRDVRGPGKTSEATKGLLVGKGAVTKTVNIVSFDSRGTAHDNEIPIRGNKEQVENIRELAVDYQDDFVYWKNLVAATAQYDYLDPNKEGIVSRHLLQKDFELKFINEVFGVEANPKGEIVPVEKIHFAGQDDVPKEILNVYTMKDTGENRDLYRHIMQALLQDGAREKILGYYKTANGVNNLAGLSAYAKEILGKAKDLANREKSREKVSIQQRMSSLVIKQGIAFDIGTAGSGPLGWQWKYAFKPQEDADGRIVLDSKGEFVYEKDATGKPIYQREQEMGGINQAGDWYTPEFPFAHNEQYDITAKKRTGLWLPSADVPRRRDQREKSPLEKPGIPYESKDLNNKEDIKNRDPWLYDEVKKIIADEDEMIVVNGVSVRAGEWRANNNFKISKEARLALKETLWFWETPYCDKNGKRMFFPSFIPHRFKLSFLDQVLTKKGDQKVSFGDRISRGEELSTLEWDNTRRYEFDRYLVNLNMSERWLRFLAEPGDSRRLDELLGGIGSIKEAIKRVNLGARGWVINTQMEEGNPNSWKSVDPVVLELSVVGQMAILNAAKASERGLKSDVISERIDDKTFRLEWETVLRDWVFMAEYMPPTKSGVIYNQTLALMMAVTGNVLYRISLEGGTQEHVDKIKAADALKGMFVDASRFTARGRENVR
jgi:hypothetical protein